MRKLIGLVSTVGFVFAGVAAVPAVGAQAPATTPQDAAAQAGTIAWRKCTDATSSGAAEGLGR